MGLNIFINPHAMQQSMALKDLLNSFIRKIYIVLLQETCSQFNHGENINLKQFIEQRRVTLWQLRQVNVFMHRRRQSWGLGVSRPPDLGVGVVGLQGLEGDRGGRKIFFFRKNEYTLKSGEFSREMIQ